MVTNQSNVSTNDEFEYGPLCDERVDEILERSEQVHVALFAKKESESFDIVLGAAASGLVALRRVVRGWDPLRGRKRIALPRQILAPDRRTLPDFPRDTRTVGGFGTPTHNSNSRRIHPRSLCPK